MDRIKFIILFCFLLFLPLITKGAVLYLESSDDEYHQNDTFIIEARIDTQSEYINVVEANLVFPEDILEIKDFSKGDSVLNLWVDEPKFSKGILSFTGGIPGGYQGKDGLLLKIIFQAKNIGLVEIKFLDDSEVLLNDGKGSKAQVSTKQSSLDILGKEDLSKNEWQEEIKKDKTSPQPFKIELSRDLKTFEGKYFIIFSTTDKETGIDHYEVKEGNKNWKVAISPYILENQKLTDDIRVKAVDKAGNYWIESFRFYEKSSWMLYGILSLLILILILVILKINKAKIKQLPR